MDITYRNSSSVKLIDTMGDDESIADAAWVSTRGSKAFEAAPERIEGLINMLMRDRHGSPFEHVLFTFGIETPIFVAREFFRHRIASYNEVSARYTVMQPNFYLPPTERPLVQKGKPGSYKFTPGTSQQYSMTVWAHKEANEQAWKSYQAMLDCGVAREVARNVLPVNLFTSFYVTMNLRSLFNFFSLRAKDENTSVPTHPLYEIEQVAKKMEAEVKEIVPVAYNAFQTNQRVSP